jgi:hypothetical protein
VSKDDTRQRGSFAECLPAVGSRQRLTAVTFGTATDGPLPRAPFAECLTLGKLVFAEYRPMPSVQHSVKRLFAEILTFPSAALGKAFFAECPTKGTRQRIQHSAKTRIPVMYLLMISSPRRLSRSDVILASVQGAVYSELGLGILNPRTEPEPNPNPNRPNWSVFRVSVFGFGPHIVSIRLSG